MKVMLCVAFFVGAFSVATAQLCTNSDACAEGSCCAGYMPFVGYCRPLSPVGTRCLDDQRMFPFSDIHIYTCPCEESLVCVTKPFLKKKNNGICVDPTPATTPSEPEVTTPDSSDSSSSSGEVTQDQSSSSGEVTQDQSSSGEVTQDQSTSGEATQDQSSSSGEATQDQSSSGEATQDQSPSSGEDTQGQSAGEATEAPDTGSDDQAQ